MNAEERQLLAEIERDERALASGWQDPPPPDLARLLQRVELAVDEAWLAEQPEPAPADDLIARVQARVEQELDAQLAGPATARPDGGTQARLLVFRLATTLAAAASVALAFVTVQAPADDLNSEWLHTEAFVRYAPDQELTDDLADIEEDLLELELAHADPLWDSLTEEALDDLDLDLDRLKEEVGWLDEWS